MHARDLLLVNLLSSRINQNVRSMIAYCCKIERWRLAGDAENAGLENAGPDLHGWKTRDNRLWNAKCLLMHKMQFQRTSQNTYCTLQSINQ